MAVKVAAVAAGKRGQFNAPKEPLQLPVVGVPWVMSVFPVNPLTMVGVGVAGSVRPKSLNEIEPVMGTAWALPMINPNRTTVTPKTSPNLFMTSIPSAE